MQPESDPACNISGKCKPYHGDTGISNCVHCGSELVEVSGGWLNSYHLPAQE